MVDRYQHRVTNVPPVLRERDGKWFVVVSDGPISLEAELSDYFMSEYVNRVLLPQIKRVTK